MLNLDDLARFVPNRITNEAARFGEDFIKALTSQGEFAEACSAAW
jgi:hypothetical protein